MAKKNRTRPKTKPESFDVFLRRGFEIHQFIIERPLSIRLNEIKKKQNRISGKF